MDNLKDYIKWGISKTDYYEEVKQDIKDKFSEYTGTLEKIKDAMYNEITGNIDGSYTYNRNEAMYKVIDSNFDALNEYVECYGDDEVYAAIGKYFVECDWEALDIISRLGVFDRVWNDLEEEGFFDNAKEEQKE